jgi:hypothetical protein
LKSPAFEQGDFQTQYYALLQTNLFMVRLEDNKGILLRNHYRWRNPPNGPEVPTRTKDEWIKCLESSNVVEQLSALVWLTGFHLASQETRMTDHNQESVEDSKRFEAVRDDARTARIMNRLREDGNKWIQQYAGLGILRSDNELYVLSELRQAKPLNRSERLGLGLFSHSPFAALARWKPWVSYPAQRHGLVCFSLGSVAGRSARAVMSWRHSEQSRYWLHMHQRLRSGGEKEPHFPFSPDSYLSLKRRFARRSPHDGSRCLTE